MIILSHWMMVTGLAEDGLGNKICTIARSVARDMSGQKHFSITKPAHTQK